MLRNGIGGSCQFGRRGCRVVLQSESDKEGYDEHGEKEEEDEECHLARLGDEEGGNDGDEDGKAASEDQDQGSSKPTQRWKIQFQKSTKVLFFFNFAKNVFFKSNVSKMFSGKVRCYNLFCECFQL